MVRVARSDAGRRVDRGASAVRVRADLAYTLALFHPDAVHALAERTVCHPEGRLRAGILPVHVERMEAQAIAGYPTRIILVAGLPPAPLRTI